MRALVPDPSSIGKGSRLQPGRADDPRGAGEAGRATRTRGSRPMDPEASVSAIDFDHPQATSFSVHDLSQGGN
jgi:hypothetical protein